MTQNTTVLGKEDGDSPRTVRTAVRLVRLLSIVGMLRAVVVYVWLLSVLWSHVRVEPIVRVRPVVISGRVVLFAATPRARRWIPVPLEVIAGRARVVT